MRTIRFRGKDCEDGEWLYGDLIQRLGYYPTILSTYPTEERKVGYAERAVKEETVGQITGLKDRNGHDIYEGDIVIQYGHGTNDIQGVVTYDASSAMFVLCYETYGVKHTETLQSKKLYADYNASFTVDAYIWNHWQHPRQPRTTEITPIAKPTRYGYRKRILH